ncbi:MAG: hypothetical protein DELT_02583 [Desulfovibrio sp.]
MPILRKDKGNRWMARVKVNGKYVASKFFPPGKLHGPEWRAAKEWEEEQKLLLLKGATIRTGLELLLAWADDYFDFVQRTMGPQSYQEKKKIMKLFLSWCSGNGVASPEAVTTAKAYAYIKSVFESQTDLVAKAKQDAEKGRKRKQGGRVGDPAKVANKARKTLAAAWSWGKKFVEGFPKSENPFTDVPKFQAQANRRYVPPEADVIKVLKLATGQDLVMLLVFYFTGARAGEVFRLSWEHDVQLDTGRIRLTDRKTGSGEERQRWHTMHPTLIAALKWWQNARPCKVDNVFMQMHCDTSMGEPFKHRSKFCERLCKRAGVKPFVFYSIRHKSAALVFADGGLNDAQQLLGHYRATTTNNYVESAGLYAGTDGIANALGSSEIGQALSGLIKENLPYELVPRKGVGNLDRVTYPVQ